MNNLVFANDKINIKSVRGIYFLFDGPTLVYIGQSENIFKRVPIHLETKKFDSWNYIEFVEEDLNILEAEFILKYKPKYNKSIPKNNRWVSQSLIKKIHNIGKVETNKMILNNEVECIIFDKTKYIKGLCDEI